ncbi:MAG TPA: hypothetical protein VG165_15030 [Solirubrobacteraceae bacterium]|nr:hypothetical protein [Solirubrobacteraceae bacterium]
MPDIKTIQDDIRARLTEVEQLIAPLRVEADQLTKLAASFDSRSAAPVAAAAPSRSRTRTGRKTAVRASRPANPAVRAKRGRPAGGGNRAQQAVEQIIKQPGITASELAAAMGIGPNYLYRVLPQLQKESKITKLGKGYHPAGDAQASAQTNGHAVTV